MAIPPPAIHVRRTNSGGFDRDKPQAKAHLRWTFTDPTGDHELSATAVHDGPTRVGLEYVYNGEEAQVHWTQHVSEAELASLVHDLNEHHDGVEQTLEAVNQIPGLPPVPNWVPDGEEWPSGWTFLFYAQFNVVKKSNPSQSLGRLHAGHEIMIDLDSMQAMVAAGDEVLGDAQEGQA